MYMPTVPKIRHKVGTQKRAHTFFGYFCIMHLMYVYIMHGYEKINIIKVMTFK